jgi:hypothetical protein
MMKNIVRGIWAGAAAGAAGTTALNAVTYLDMTLRGRGSSGVPATVVERLADKASVEVPGDQGTKANRLSGAGGLAGIVTGLGVGAAYGLARSLGMRMPAMAGSLVTGLAAMAATDGSIAALDVSDPAEWSGSDWLSDLVPHLAYGLVTASCAQALI